MSSLFKYVPPDRADIVENLCIRFSPFAEFNDPFESLPNSQLVEDPIWQQRLEDKCVAVAQFDSVAKSVQTRSPISFSEHRFRRLHREQYASRIPELKRRAVEIFTNDARKHFRILSLSQCAPDTDEAALMWGHYTNAHQGLVLEFEATHDWVQWHKPERGPARDMGPVDYRPKRAAWDFSTEGEARPRSDFVMSKSSSWAYEQEFRLLRTLESEDLDASKVDSLVSFPPDLLRSVTFGVNTSDATKARVRAACARPELRHVKLRQAEIHPDEYRLAIVDDDPLPEAN